MTSPFPGMDPFIENQKWEDFHTSFMSAIRDALVPSVRPKYVVDVEKRVYLERIDPVAPVQTLVADAAIYHRFDHLTPSGPTGAGTALASEPSIVPKVCTIPYFEEHRETFITIRRGSPSEVVTVIELLSPTNKRKGTEGREQYLEKVHALMKTKASLVELDLLRGGERSTVSNPPPGDYFALVSKPKPRPLAEVYGWAWNDRLPRILIPLSIEDPDVPLDLQAVFDLVYDRAGYDYSINYQLPVSPAFAEPDARYVQSRLI
ncbi:MAG: DUF4058 family protein [Pirellula sp.]